ncbi:MAG: hypothetical protein EOP04_17850 [Proteobacteria bacterium]|nr:MAG: hypothetical protein EOP04_17850 [Pseudomonadota bacterium]
MKLKKMVIVAALTVPTLGACGKADSTQSSEVKGDGSSKDKKSVFNLAEYLQTSPYSEELKSYVNTGDVIFGDMNKLGIRSNVKVETSGETSLTPNGKRNITSMFYLNGAIYPRGVKLPDGTVASRIGIKLANGTLIKNNFIDNGGDPTTLSDEEVEDLEYQIVDIQAKAGFDVQGIEGHFRFLGKDVYKPQSLKAVYEFSETREVSVGYPIFPGGVVKASIGGELGFKAEAVVRKDDAISLHFQPKMSIQSSAQTKIKALVVAGGIKGVLTLLETAVNTSASISYLPKQDFAYGDISMDSAEIKALDGKVFLFASIGLDTLFENFLGDYLPVGSKEIWKKVSGFFGVKLEKEWKHTIWDPEPVFTRKIPARGVFFTSNTEGMSSSECSEVRDEVYAAGDLMAKEKKKASGVDADIAQSAEANLAKTALFLNSNCGK